MTFATLELFDHSLFRVMKAPADLAGAALTAPVAIAGWAIFAAPAILVLLWLFGATDDRRAAIRATFVATAGLTISAIISSLYFHPRPFMDGASRNFLSHAVDSSFPSDHAAVLFALAFSLVLSRSRKSRLGGAILLIVAPAVGWARIFLGAHYPLDVVGGAGIGLTLAAAFALKPLRLGVDRVSDIVDWTYAALWSGFVGRAN